MTVLPPFNINEAIPADNGIVSQHPTGARTFRDTVESWLLVNHNVNGRHDKVELDYLADLTGVASVTKLWASNTGSAAGALKYVEGAGNVAFLLPPAMIVAYAADAAPEGWLLCAGQEVSRSTYARLFAVVSTTWGVGNGSTTFNVPDLRGRVIAGQDDMNGTSANRLTGLTNGVNGDTFAAAGGLESTALSITEMPSHTHTGTSSSDGAHTHSYGSGIQGAMYQGGGNGAWATSITNAQTTTSNGAHTHTFTTDATGSGTAHNNVQPTLIMNYIIKT